MENQMSEIVHGAFSAEDLQKLYEHDKKKLIEKVGIELLNLIPNVGSIFAATPELYQGYRENEFFRKLCKVLLEIKDVKEPER